MFDIAQKTKDLKATIEQIKHLSELKKELEKEIVDFYKTGLSAELECQAFNVRVKKTKSYKIKDIESLMKAQEALKKYRPDFFIIRTKHEIDVRAVNKLNEVAQDKIMRFVEVTEKESLELRKDEDGSGWD